MESSTQPEQQRMRISLKDTKELLCPCGHNHFREVISLREVSALITGTGKAEIIPAAVVICDKCGKPFEQSTIIV